MGDMARDKMQEDLKNKVHFYDSVEGIDRLFSSNQDFVNQIRKELLSKHLHVFDTKGCVIYLPKDSTVIDYLYAVYKDKAPYVERVSVNGNLLDDYSYVLQNNDIVSITLGLQKNVNPEKWFGMATTSLARSLIKKGN